jgi:serine phosphatase RsbU (regulator of sigma subunit)
MDEQYVWLATTNGVIVIDKKGNFVKKFDLNSRLPHNSINKILLTDEGAYIGTESEYLYRIDRDFEIVAGDLGMSGSTRNKILAFSKGKDGSIWAATEGNGVFRFLNDTLSGVTQSDGLMSNYTYSILADSDNDIWIGHSKGFSRYDPSAGTVRVLGSEFPKIGICNTNGIFESADKKIFIGTTEGFLVYDREKDNKTRLAPFTNINYIEINDISYPYQPSFVLPFSRYKIRVHYSGINFSDPEKVYYSSILDNFDVDRTETTSREASYSLSDGKYRFNVMSVSQDGQESETVSFNILIKKPFYRMWWFILLVLAIVTVVVFVIVREREKAQKKIQEYLEKELEARTRVVVKQKGELELQNIEITDSINYAKRIQTSILPDINKLKETFSDAFILFQPRDIVSGDFYWFDKVGDDKFILVCADSTGHGVPGAFMSMIGSTLLQDIINSKKISKPSEILKMLDRQIFSTLNQNAELGISNDGMDLVVCEFNISKRHVRFASAMRPVILVIDGESLYIKGSRSSVGGESVNEKFFDDQEYYLNEGDTIYLFSDGMPDQFGGRDGKKLKIARLKKLIESISKMPMNEQKAEMTKFYLEWKGSFDQVDDVLLMGVRV